MEMAIKDRGNIKWSSLMLTEHRRRLRNLKKEDESIGKPELDEQLLEDMNYILHKALYLKKELKIVYFKEGRRYLIRGKLLKCDSFKKNIIIRIEKNIKKIIQLEDIIELDL